MITLQDLNVICINPFQIMPVDGNNSDFLATTSTIYGNKRGGIRANPKLEIKNIKYGYLLFNQIVLRHNLIIKNSYGTHELPFLSKNKYKDTPNKEKDVYRKYLIYNDKVCLEFGKGYTEEQLKKMNNARIRVTTTNTPIDLLYHDIPFMQLLVDWVEWEYYTEFQTWIQYIPDWNEENNIIPICSFDWWLYAKAKKHSFNHGNFWILQENEYSTINEINQSVRYPNQPLIIDSSYLQISEEVEKWRKGKNLW